MRAKNFLDSFFATKNSEVTSMEVFNGFIVALEKKSRNLFRFFFFSSINSH